MWYLDLYYLVGFFFFILNLYYLANGLPEFERSKIMESDNPKGVIGYLVFSAMIFKIPYIVWIIIGLVTHYWFLFSILLILTFFLFMSSKSCAGSYKSLFERISLIIESLIIGFVSFNHFHFHLELQSIIYNLIF